MEKSDAQLLNSVTTSVVWQGEDGETYVWKVSRSDVFPEPAFVVNACPIQIELEQDGAVFFGYGFGGLSSSDAVAVEWKAELKDGMCIKPERHDNAA